ncbi:uncharacterized zinc finger protein CG2678 isoform X1 [Drosophila santomea]|uniref:uncharacterized zinc finger protein CG2678 isoform X1 n=1 Tax=Drosophila santomea TaxID=129105 RepID=UPI0019532041|nr:uncharacterized zinc finger protein CG2678 isoform X1 [Drosophila santomea]XP_039493629.1 uncharacterized zinc finger protein CG2678 isoform X1 [Drosophila santomea]XP_039493630.1 uncharacterized zinc finger protein CG2678 isoform X1 [Drosophila santomea]
MMTGARNVCRTCMDETATLVDIFANVRDPVLDEPEMSLSHIVARCTDRPVKRGDLLPQYICLSCVLAVQNAFRFKWKSEQSYQHFFRLLNQSSSPEDQLHLIACNQDENQTQKMQLKSDLQEDLQQTSNRQQSERDLGKTHTLQTKLQVNHEDGPPETFTPHPRRRTCRTKEQRDRIPKEAPRSTKIINPQVRCDANGYYTCPHCSKRFYSQTQLRTHISDLCNRCPYCPRSYKQKSNLKRHLRTHVAKPAHKCFHCSKAFMRKDHLKRHLSIHDSDGPLSCSQCSAVFIESVQLEIHRREHLLQAASLKSESTKEPDSDVGDEAHDLKPNCTKNSPTTLKSTGELSYDSYFFCKENIQNIFKERVLRDRELRKSGEVLPGTTQDGADVKENEIQILDRIRSTPAEKPKCHLCLKKFSSIYNLKRHMLTHNRHTDLKKCSYCSEEFHTEKQMKRHERGHSGELFRCEYCSLVFLDVDYLRKHKKRIHSNNLITIQEKIMSKRMASGGKQPKMKHINIKAI